tara:strand:+ start:2594 stop:3004 length:411 start_codon:yes stop_codon:yes gene_type:complete
MMADKRKYLKSKKKEFKQKLKKNISDLSQKDKSNLQAIAIKYDKDKKSAPKIIATGKGKIAESILEIAESNDIPFYEDETLANILSKLDLETEIPKELFGIFAEILAFVYHLDQLASKRSKFRDRFARLKNKRIAK